MPNEKLSPVQLFDNPHAPEFFVTELCGAVPSANGNAYLTFATARRNADHTAIARLVTLRVVMPSSSLKDAIAFLQAQLEQAEQKDK